MNAFVVTEKQANFILPYVPMDYMDAKNIVLGCVDDEGTCVGVSVFQITEDLGRLLYIYVADAYRRKGAGCAMMDLFTRIAGRNGIVGVEVNFFLEEDTEGLLQFFRSMDFIEDEDLDSKCPEITTTLSELEKNIPTFKVPKEYTVLPLKDVTGKMFRQAKDTLNKFSASEAFVPLLPMESYSSSLSFLAFRNQEPKGGLMVRKLSDEEMEVSYIWTIKRNPKLLLAVLNESLAQGKKELSSDCTVRMIGFSKEGAALIRKLSGKKAVLRTPVRMLFSI